MKDRLGLMAMAMKTRSSPPVATRVKTARMSGSRLVSNLLRLLLLRRDAPSMMLR